MPDKIVIINSTPIISLNAINELDILRNLYGSVIIPNAVFKEITAKNNFNLAEYDWIMVKNIKNIIAKETFVSALHDGEVEVMILAKELNAGLIIIDDFLARKHAKYLNLPLTGTIGVLLKAKQAGIIDKISPLLNDLINNGFYISNSVYSEILKLANE